MTNELAIEAIGLHKAYGHLRVLDGIDVRVARGTVVSLLGPNGAGKTTTIRILATLLAPDAGSARVAGFDVVSARREVRRRIGLTGQYAAVDDQQTGEENLRTMGRLAGLSGRDARRRAAELLGRFDLRDAAARRAGTYSGGMRRRLDLAAGLVARPEVIFLDEPTTGLDPRSRQTMWGVIEELVADGASVLLTTQYLEEADRLADRVAVLDGGRIVAEGAPAELKQRVAGRRLDLTFADRNAYEEADQTIGREPAARASGRSAGAICEPDRPVLGVGTATLRDPDRLTLGVPTATLRDPDRLTLGIPTDGSAAHVRALLDAIDPDRTSVAHFEVHTATLDDVFLALTGHAAVPEHSDPTPEPAHA